MNSIWITTVLFIVLVLGIVGLLWLNLDRLGVRARREDVEPNGESIDAALKQSDHRFFAILVFTALLYLGVLMTIPWIFNLKDPALQRGLGYVALAIFLLPIGLSWVYMVKKGVFKTQ